MTKQEVLILAQSPNSANSQAPSNQVPANPNISIDFSTLIWMITTAVITWLLTYWCFKRTLDNTKIERTRQLFRDYKAARKAAEDSIDQVTLKNNTYIILEQAKDYFYDMKKDLILQRDFQSFVQEFAFDIEQIITGLAPSTIRTAIDDIDQTTPYFKPETKQEFHGFITHLRGQTTSIQVKQVLQKHFSKLNWK